MLISLALSFAAQMVLGPNLPPGARPEFQQACIQVEEQLEKGDFEAAEKLLWLLPKKNISVVWDDSKVPPSFRNRYARARDLAFSNWSRRLSEVNITFVQANGDLRFSFEPTLAVSAVSGLPAGSALFFSQNASEPRLEAVIGMKRGQPLEPSSDESIHNEVSFALGAYLGLATSPLGARAMGRTDLPVSSMVQPTPSELEIAQLNQRAAMALQAAVQKKTRLAAARPEAKIDPLEVVQPPVLQGTQIDFSIVVTNIGNAPLVYRGIPDCGCVSTQRGDKTIQPGASGLLQVRLDTTDFSGSTKKHLILMSNDFEQPIRSIPIMATSSPRYRFLSSAPSTMVIPEGSAKFDVFLVTPEGKPLDVAGVSVEGIPGTAKFFPWKGTMADPDLNEGPRPRVGTKIHVELQDSGVPGRAPFTIRVRTKDPTFREVLYNAAVQKGIVALPGNLFLGEVGADPRQAAVVLSRPGAPFKVVSAESTSAYVGVSVKPSRGDWEYQLNVVYKGGAPKGDFQATITVKTNDPRQPKLLVPVQATVR